MSGLSEPIAKPLHVQVAEALGCKVEWQGFDEEWRCGCADGAHSPPHPDGAWLPGVARYDTDWAATGPLIDKYDVSIGRPWNNPAICLAIVVGEPPVRNVNGGGDTKLEAVCRLILALKAEGKLNG